MHFVGLLGMPRRVYTYALRAWASTAMNLMATIGALDARRLGARSSSSTSCASLQERRAGAATTRGVVRRSSGRSRHRRRSITSPRSRHVHSLDPLWHKEGREAALASNRMTGPIHMPPNSIWPAVQRARHDDAAFGHRVRVVRSGSPDRCSLCCRSLFLGLRARALSHPRRRGLHPRRTLDVAVAAAHTRTSPSRTTTSTGPHSRKMVFWRSWLGVHVLRLADRDLSRSTGAATGGPAPARDPQHPLHVVQRLRAAHEQSARWCWRSPRCSAATSARDDRSRLAADGAARGMTFVGGQCYEFSRVLLRQGLRLADRTCSAMQLLTC